MHGGSGAGPVELENGQPALAARGRAMEEEVHVDAMLPCATGDEEPFEGERGDETGAPPQGLGLEGIATS